MVTIITTAAAFIGACVGVSAYFWTRSEAARQRRESDAKQDEIGQSALRIATETQAKVDREVPRLWNAIAEQQHHTGILETKMEVFWRNMAVDVANVLHSPHEGWRGLDILLEKFRDETITDTEMSDLTAMLRMIVDGSFAELMTVSRADQVAASLLLRAIEVTRGTVNAGTGQE